MSNFREGGRIIIPGHTNPATRDVFMTALIGSMSLGGRPVRCSGIVSGVTMLIGGGKWQPQDGEQAERMAADTWNRIEPKLADWLTMRAPPAGMTIQLADLKLEFGRDNARTVGPGVMDVVVTHESATVAMYSRRRRQQPLVGRFAN